jgi:iron complex transport system ATP-binding protein
MGGVPVSESTDTLAGSEPVLIARGLTKLYRMGEVTVHALRGIDLEFAAGEFVAILGRNGSGKTLTLHTLAGLRAPHAGSVTLDGASLAGQGRRAVARRLGLLMQDMEDSFATTAMESVLIGRHPHLALWQWEGAEDERLARAALTRLDLGDAGERSTATLSGGEQRRVAIASLLAQQPQVFLLDEPTNHLDPHHQLTVLGLVRELANEGRSVIATLHDPTLAARFADRIVLLFGDGRWRAGPARELLTGETLSELYLTKITEVAAGDRRIFVSA